jgi:hypothetical protein
MVGLTRGTSNTLFDRQPQNHSQSQKACAERQTNSRLKSAKSIPQSQERASVLCSIARTAACTELHVTYWLAVGD